MIGNMQMKSFMTSALAKVKLTFVSIYNFYMISHPESNLGTVLTPISKTEKENKGPIRINHCP